MCLSPSRFDRRAVAWCFHCIRSDLYVPKHICEKQGAEMPFAPVVPKYHVPCAVRMIIMSPVNKAANQEMKNSICFQGLNTVSPRVAGICFVVARAACCGIFSRKVHWLMRKQTICCCTSITSLPAGRLRSSERHERQMIDNAEFRICFGFALAAACTRLIRAECE
jgi:hypothetical protein